MTVWRIRQVGPLDAAAVLASDVFDGPALPAAVAAFLGADGAGDPRNILILAEQEGRAVGFASGTVLDHPDKPRALLVQELGVNAEARRQGIARALIAALRAAGRQRGCRVTWVLTEEDNIAARAAYAAAGGRETTGVVMVEWDEPASLSDLSHDQPLRPPAPDG
jgi:ribosomal protein S18 acetylase RimI-like enzyme